MEPILIRYRMTESEFMEACRAHWSVQRLGLLSNTVVGVSGVLVGSVLFFFVTKLALFLVAVGALLLLVTWLRSVLWTRAFRGAKKYHEDISVAIRDDSIHVESAEGRSELNWSFFTWYLDTPDHILLYTTKQNFSVIPKKSFPNTQAVAQFLTLVTERLRRIK